MEMPLVIVGIPQQDTWHLDIDVVGGMYEEIPGEESNKSRQQASMSALISKGTIPGLENEGADWSQFLAGNISLLEVDNDVKKSIMKYSGSTSVMNTYYPLYQQAGSGIQLQLVELEAYKND
ncbi:MAG: hypothetical protein ACRCUS_00600 [Anaerovoracaceae bacterium]